MKVGILGGTFNPVHFGHLINAQSVKEEFGLEKILFVPSKSPVHKDLQYHVSAEDRFRMLEIAIAGHDGFDISRIEIDRDSPSYMVFTVEELLLAKPDWEPYLIIGYDAYCELDTWYDYSRLKILVSFIVMNRPVRDDCGGKRDDAVFAHNPMIDISSSCIRERIRAGRSVRFLLPVGVIEYINERGLYNQ